MPPGPAAGPPRSAGRGKTLRAVVPVDDAGLRAARSQPEGRDRELRVDQLPGDDEDEGRVPRPVVALRQVGKSGGCLSQRREAVHELGVGEACEGGIAEGEQGVHLTVQDGRGGHGDARGGCARGGG